MHHHHWRVHLVAGLGRALLGRAWGGRGLFGLEGLGHPDGQAQDPLPQAGSPAFQPPPAAAAAQAAEEEDKEDHLKRKENVYCLGLFGPHF